MREHDRERDLPHERRLAGHVRPRHDPQPRALRRRVGRGVEHEVVGDEASGRGEPLDDGVPCASVSSSASESSTSGRV